MRIAIADDEQLLLTYMTNLVRELLPDAEIDSFISSVKLLDSAKRYKYDIAFLDIQMPCFTGVEIAEELKQTNPKMNIIFVTGYDGYQGNAMELFASGYVKKPATKEKLQVQLENLRYPIEEEKKLVFVQTFGNFSLFVDGKVVSFTRGKTMQAFAYLVHRRGSVVGRKELSAVIFDDGIYDSNRASYISKLCADMQSTLQDLGVPDLLEANPAGLSVNVNKFDCDLYDFLNGKEGAKQLFSGEYMSQYDFGRETEAMLNNMI